MSEKCPACKSEHWHCKCAVNDCLNILARERDQFGKMETELLAKLAVAREALEHCKFAITKCDVIDKALEKLNDEAK